MKRLIGFIIAVAGIVALVAFQTFKIKILDESETVTLLDYFKEEAWRDSFFEAIKLLFKDGSKDAWLSLIVFGIGIVGLPLCLLLAGMCKKFGRSFWALLAIGCFVLGVLVMNGKIEALDKYSGLYLMFNGIPYIGYYIAGGCGLLLFIMPIVWRD